MAEMGKKEGPAKVERWDDDSVAVKIGDFPLCRYPKELAEDGAQIYADLVNETLSRQFVRRETADNTARTLSAAKEMLGVFADNGGHDGMSGKAYRIILNQIDEALAAYEREVSG